MNENEEIVKDETIQVSIADVAEPQPATTASESEDLAAKLAEMTDKYLRTAAELENTRRRAVLDSESAARARAINIADKFLPLIDAIDAAAIQAPDDAGIQALVSAMNSILANIGITKIESVGKPLDPTLHNAIQVVPKTEEFDAGIIASELQSGYKFGDVVLRTAMVMVAG